MNILLIDDDLTVSLMLQRELEKSRHKVDAYVNPKFVSHILRRHVIAIYSKTDAMMSGDRSDSDLRNWPSCEKLGQSELLEPYRTQRVAKDGTVKKVMIVSTALVNEAGQVYAISATERGGSDQ
jgi:hypothetical protein